MFCNWGIPSMNDKMIWPYSPKSLTLKEPINLFNDGKIVHEARCIDADEFYGRLSLYPGWPCLIDMDCSSKKCLKGVCAGRLSGESCNENIDCVSGLFCDKYSNPTACRVVKGWRD